LFYNIPLTGGNYKKWKEEFKKRKDLGIDSIAGMGIYSSLKSGDHFPFPDSIPVKLLIDTALIETDSATYLFDLLKIEGVFGDHKQSKNNVQSFYNDFVNKMKNYYLTVEADSIEKVTSFSGGKNYKFPSFRIYWGYLEELRFFYLVFEFYQSKIKRH
jgi:hypothetical protein